MDEENKQNQSEQKQENGGFDYNDLISEFSAKNMDPDAPNLDNVNLDELLKDDKEIEARQEDGKKTQAQEIDAIFNDLDDLVRSDTEGDDESVVLPESGNDAEGKKQDGFSFEGLELAVDEGDGGYASLISQMDDDSSAKNGDGLKMAASMEEIDLGFLDNLDEEEQDAVSGSNGSADHSEPLEMDEIVNAGESEPAVDAADADTGEYTEVADIPGMDGNDDSPGTLKSDTDAVEGIITGEFSMDEVDVKPAVPVENIDSPDAGEDAPVIAEAPVFEGGSEASATGITGEVPVVDEEKSVWEESAEDKVDASEDASYADVLTGFDVDSSESESETAVVIDEENENGGIDLDFNVDESSATSQSGAYVDALADFSEEDGASGAESDQPEDASALVIGDDDAADEFSVNLFGDDEEEEASGPAPDTVSAEQKDEVPEEDDFLGLNSVSSEGAEDDRFAETAEVLYEGVEMDFVRQSDLVTMAELLIAQGKKDEANALFHEVEDCKGVTGWVARRLVELSPDSRDAGIQESE